MKDWKPACSTVASRDTNENNTLHKEAGQMTHTGSRGGDQTPQWLYLLFVASRITLLSFRSPDV